jgi:N-acetylglucosamine malate deacetylase 1
MKILAVGAHPDDIEIFMYGLIAACKQRGDEIILCVATDGAAGNIQINNNLKKIREKETVLGLAKVGIPCFLELIDGNLDGSLNAYKIICDYINDIKPDLVITHDPNDYHPDHRSLSKYITKSVGFKCPVLFAETLLGINFIPDIYVDITDYFEEKKNAILSHKSQNPFAFIDAVEISNRYRSAQCNAPNQNYAEVYRVSKTFPFADIRQILPKAPKLRPFYEKNIDSLI